MTRRLVAAALLAAALGCTQETQNELGRSIQNWTGTDGCSRCTPARSW